VSGAAGARGWLPLLALALLGPRSAAAAEVVYGPDGAPTVVQNKLHAMSGRFELGGRLALALNTSLVDQLGGLISVSYHPNEWLDYGGELLLHYTQLSGLANDIRSQLPARYDVTTNKDVVGSELSNSGQLRLGALAAARLAPLYGKLNLASELAVHFQAYGLFGLGVAQVHKESVNLCAVAGRSPCPAGSFQVTDGFKPLGELGVGLRFYLGDKWSTTVEVRSYLFPASQRQDADLTNPASGTDAAGLGLVTDLALGLSHLF
jgi:outer membrane beta-barrel protein